MSPRLAALRAEPFAGHFDADSSLAAELVLELYQTHNSSSDALIMLSQLQVSLPTPASDLLQSPRQQPKSSSICHHIILSQLQEPCWNAAAVCGKT